MSTLIVSGLAYSYKGGSAHFAVHDMTFSCKSGQIACFVGPSGSGKTTILRLINGELKADAGSVALDDTSLNEIPLGGRSTATVWQIGALLPYLTAIENVKLAAVLSGLTSNAGETLGREVLSQLAAEELSDRPINTLSGGELQRVSIARALVCSPRILLLDEPTSSLDMINRDRLSSLLLNLRARRSDMITVIVTHDRDLCFRVADEIHVVENGRLIWSGRAEDTTRLTMPARAGQLLATVHVLNGTVTNGTFHLAPLSTDYKPLSLDLPIGNRDQPENAALIISRRNICVTPSDGGTNPTHEISLVVQVINSYISNMGDALVDVRLASGHLLTGVRSPVDALQRRAYLLIPTTNLAVRPIEGEDVNVAASVSWEGGSE